MSFRTDGFEPSAYTIPPPRPWVRDQQLAPPAGEPDHSATAAITETIESLKQITASG
jgi:hypothetical protein